MVRIPLIPSNNRPKDDVELSERESALVEKEREIEGNVIEKKRKYVVFFSSVQAVFWH